MNIYNTLKVGKQWTTEQTYLYWNAFVHVSVCSYMWCRTKLDRAKPWLKHTQLLSQSILKRP